MRTWVMKFEEEIVGWLIREAVLGAAKRLLSTLRSRFVRNEAPPRMIKSAAKETLAIRTHWSITPAMTAEEMVPQAGGDQ